MDPNQAVEYLQKWRVPGFLACEFCSDLGLVLWVTWLLCRKALRQLSSLQPTLLGHQPLF